MRIAILGCTLRRPLTGIGYYTLHLAERLARRSDGNEYVVVMPAGDGYVTPDAPTIRVPLRGMHRRAAMALWELVDVQGILRRGDFELVHSPGGVKVFVPPPPPGQRRILTVHDITPVLHPETHPWRRRLEFEVLLRLALRNASGVITDSQNSLGDLRTHYPRTRRMPMASVHLGVEERYLASGHSRPEIPGLPEGYFLCVGSIEPRKNLDTVLRAFSTYLRNGGTAQLVIAGPAGWRNQSFYDLISELRIRDRIVFPGYVPHDSMPGLYAHARAFLYPSLYEGFGLPPLEAMAAGCPVITSRSSSIPEVVGDAAILLEPLDAARMAASMLRLDTDESARRELAERGQKRAAMFTWDQTAARTAEFYSRVLD